MSSPAPDPPADSPAARLAKSEEDKKKKGKDAAEHGNERRGLLYNDCAASLEFVEGWSWKRILLAVMAVTALALAAALCWMFLGNDLQPYVTGYRSAGERVAGGAMLGGFVLLVGWTWVGVWLLLSALVG
jgi:ABC-type Fe3+-siderophore transport system permease subunit